MNDIKTLSFGRYLKAIRLQKGIRLEDISGKTRIAMNNLLLIEREDHEKLPPEVYVKGFLRAYAGAVDADADFVIQNYLNNLNIFKRSAQSENDLKKSEEGFWRRLILSLAALVCFMILVVVGAYLFREDSAGRKTDQQAEIASPVDKSPVKGPSGPSGSDSTEQPVLEESAPVRNKALVPAEDIGLKSEEALAAKWRLKINAVEETWIKIIVDSQGPKEYTLKSGDLLEFEAFAGYNILIGNAGGIHMTLNDAPVKTPGKSGQVVTLQLP